MKKRMFLMLLGAGLFFGFIFGMKALGSYFMNQAMDNMPEPPATVTVAVAAEETWSEDLSAVGTALAVNGTHVTTEVGGIVAAIHFESGQPVKRGDLLVTLENGTESATLQALEASARLAVSQRDRFRSLYAQRLVSSADLDQRESEAAAALANAASQRARLAQRSIRAPFDGVLGIRQVNLGQFIAAGEAIVSLQALDPILVNFTLPEQRLAQARVGTGVRASTDALPGQVFEGEIVAIEPEVDTGTRNFRLQARLPNPGHGLRPGNFLRVRFAVGEPAPVVVVPQTAIAYASYGNSVYVIAEGEDGGLRARQRFVRTGPTRGDLVAILEGLEAGERVASSGLLKLRNDAGVVVSEGNEPNAEADPRPANR